MNPKEWLTERYSDKSELFDALYRLFRNQVTPEMVVAEFGSEMAEEE